MKAALYVIFSVLLLLAAKPALADKGDTVKGKKRPLTYSFTESMFAPGNIWAQNGWQNMHITDTTLNSFEVYVTHYTLGNTGLPCVPVVFNPGLQPMGFYYGQDYVSNNFYADSSVRYFDTRAPYVQFYYISDPQIHQFFRFTYAQNIGKNLDISLGFKRIRSEGNYLNQSTNMNQLTLDANYHTKHYLAFADIIYTVHKFQQNGGIDSALDNPNYSDRQTMPIGLNYATSELFEQSFHLQQYYFLGFRDEDSIEQKPLFYISHSLRVSGHSNVFTDNGVSDSSTLTKSPYYELFAPTTHDSLRYNEFSNDVSIGSGTGWTIFPHWEAGIKQQWVHYRNYIGINPQLSDLGTLVLTNQEFIDDVYTNLISHARIYNGFDNNKILVDVSGQYIFNGTQQGDEQGLAQIGLKLDSTQFLKLAGTYSNQAPPFLSELYEGNNINWINQFKNTTTSNIALTYYHTKWKLGISLQATQMTNMIYFDSITAQPMQYQPTFMVYCAGITKDFKLYKFHWVTSEKVQYVADSVPLRLPRLVTENSVFLETYLFHRALFFRFGADFYWNSSYYGYAYMPVTDQYYLENSTKLGNYVYIDPFVSFRIKTFRMFIKMENATQGLTPENYYYAFHYPMPDRTLRFGICWDFWN